MNKRSWKLAAGFSIAVFAIITTTMLLIGGTAMLLFRLDVIQSEQNPTLLFITFAIVSIILGTFLATSGSKKIIAPIVAITEATKEVAKGNFDIVIPGDSRAEEVNVMAHNFMRMTQELANTETFRNDFIHNVSHEFKTPLAAIEGYAMLLQNKSLSEEKRDAYVAKILFNTKRLSTLTGNILQLSRLENQEITTQKEHFSLDEQLREDLLLFETEWDSKNVSLDIELEAVNYYGNRDLLSQVWQNLIGNAVKYVAADGCIRLILKQEADCVKVYVSDNGCGMPEDVKNRIFEKFYQGDSSHSGEGNGLGLTLVKRIVDLHDGSITVSSKEGKGSTFVVSLPLQG